MYYSAYTLRLLLHLYKYDLFQIEDQILEGPIGADHLVQLCSHFGLIGTWIDPVLVEELVVKAEDFVAEGLADLRFPYLCGIYFLRGSARVLLLLLLLLARLLLGSQHVLFEVVLEPGHDALHQARVFLLDDLLLAEVVHDLELVGALRDYRLIVISIGLVILQLRRLELVDLALSRVHEVHSTHALRQVDHYQGSVLVLRCRQLLWGHDILDRNPVLSSLCTTEISGSSPSVHLSRGHHLLLALVSARVDLFQFLLISNLVVLFRLGSALFHQLHLLLLRLLLLELHPLFWGEACELVDYLGLLLLLLLLSLLLLFLSLGLTRQLYGLAHLRQILLENHRFGPCYLVLLKEFFGFLADQRHLEDFSGRRSLGGILFEELIDEIRQVFAVPLLVDRLMLLRDNFEHQAQQVVGHEGLFQLAELVENDSEGPNVAFGGVRLTLAGFRRHVVWRAHDSHGSRV